MGAVDGRSGTFFQFAVCLLSLVSFDTNMVHQELIVSVLGRDLLPILGWEGLFHAYELSNILYQGVWLLYPVNIEHLFENVLQALALRVLLAWLSSFYCLSRPEGTRSSSLASGLLLLFLLHNLNLFLSRSEEELTLGDTLDLLLTLTSVVPEFDRVFVLSLEPLDCAVSVVGVEVAVPPPDVRNL